MVEKERKLNWAKVKELERELELVNKNLTDISVTKERLESN